MEKKYSHKRKHTLDSDEEDEPEVNKFCKDNLVEGDEEGNIDIEDGVKFTPFNMKDELEEGNFENGTYLFKQNKDEIKDAWIDNINWSQVKELEKTLKNKEEKEARDEANAEEEKVDQTSLMQSMLKIMIPKESVTKAIKRLDISGGTIGAWQKKKKAKHETNTEDAANIEKSKQQLSEMISHADKILSMGMYNIYQETYESLSFKLSQKSKQTPAVDDIDMFGSTDPKPVVAEPAPETTISDDIQWHFKWSNDDSEVYGPYSSDQMLQWQEEGYFKDGVFVRKSSEENKEFYSSNRIDFGLYL